MWDWGHSQFLLIFPCKGQQKTSVDSGMCPNNAEFFCIFYPWSLYLQKGGGERTEKKEEKKQQRWCGVVWCGVVWCLHFWFDFTCLSIFPSQHVFSVVILDSREEAEFGCNDQCLSSWPCLTTTTNKPKNLIFSEDVSEVGMSQIFVYSGTCTEFTCILSLLHPGITCMAD